MQPAVHATPLTHNPVFAMRVFRDQSKNPIGVTNRFLTCATISLWVTQLLAFYIQVHVSSFEGSISSQIVILQNSVRDCSWACHRLQLFVELESPLLPALFYRLINLSRGLFPPRLLLLTTCRAFHSVRACVSDRVAINSFVTINEYKCFVAPQLNLTEEKLSKDFLLSTVQAREFGRCTW
jgi:hypothetical protein